MSGVFSETLQSSLGTFSFHFDFSFSSSYFSFASFIVLYFSIFPILFCYLFLFPVAYFFLFHFPPFPSLLLSYFPFVLLPFPPSRFYFSRFCGFFFLCLLFKPGRLRARNPGPGSGLALGRI